MTNTKSFFWENEARLESLQKVSPCFGVWYRFVLESIKSLNRIFSGLEYWLKACECQIWSSNRRRFFWETETNLGTLQKVLRYVGASYKFFLKCVRNFSWMWISFFQMLWMSNVQLSNTQLEIITDLYAIYRYLRNFIMNL